MLKSRFNISQGDEDEHLEEEHVSVEEAIVDTEVFPKRTLNRSEISQRLKFMGKTADGDGYTYLKVSCTDMKLTNVLAIKAFKHLQFVDVSNNHIELEAMQAITELPYLVVLHADKNLLHSAALNKAKYLQVLILNYNYLTTVHDVFQPELSTFEVGYNKIQRVFFENRMPNIKCLDFRYNLIQDITGIDFPNLDSLYLAGNKVKSLIGLERLVNLRILHMRYNPIKSLDGFDAGLTKLQYVNLRNCKITTLKQVKKLKVLTALDTLIIKGCPYMGGTGEEDAEGAAAEEDTELRVEVLATLPRLKRLNKSVVSPEERTEAKDLMMQWLEEGENDEEEVEEEHHLEESGNED